jgi:hypothetical protein
MEFFQILGSVSSFLSLIVSLYVAQKVIKIGNSISVKGKDNLTVGGNYSSKN